MSNGHVWRTPPGCVVCVRCGSIAWVWRPRRVVRSRGDGNTTPRLERCRGVRP